MGEKLDVRITDPDDETYTVDHQIDIDKINVSKNKDHDPKVTIDDQTTVIMGYPDIHFFAEGVSVDSITDRLDLAAKCVKQIVIGEEVYNKGDMSEREIQEWLEGLTSEQFGKIMAFFLTMLVYTVSPSPMLTKKKFGNPGGLADFSDGVDVQQPCAPL